MKNGVFWDIKTRSYFTGFDVFTAETMKNAVVWDINTHFIPHRRNITSQLLSAALLRNVGSYRSRTA
jgi:hypothetical protein